MLSLEVSNSLHNSIHLFFDANKIKQRSELLHRFCRDHDIELYFAVKACSEPQLLNLIAPYVDGFDVSNLNELQTIKSFNKPITLYDPTGQTPWNLDATYVSETLSHLDFNPSKFLRFNATELFPSKTQSRFGLSPEELSQVHDIQGVHIHLRELHEYNLQDFKKIISFLIYHHPNLSTINLGGGWHKLETNNEYQKVLKTLRCENPNLKFRIEPGRFFTWDCGQIYGHIVSLNRKHRALTTNISSYLHLNWCDPQLVAPTGLDDQEIIQIFGPTCFEFDQIGTFAVSKNWWLNLKIGDEISFSKISSYTLQRQAEFNGYKKTSFGLKYVVI